MNAQVFRGYVVERPDTSELLADVFVSPSGEFQAWTWTRIPERAKWFSCRGDAERVVAYDRGDSRVAALYELPQHFVTRGGA